MSLHSHPYVERKITQEELVELIAKAKDENHGVFVPTHPIKKEGALVGYFSIGTPGYPVVFAWLSTEILARESFALVNLVENLVALGGSNGVCFPVPKHSPFYELMEHMGYKNGGEYTFFVKQL